MSKPRGAAENNVISSLIPGRPTPQAPQGKRKSKNKKKKKKKEWPTEAEIDLDFVIQRSSEDILSRYFGGKVDAGASSLQPQIGTFADTFVKSVPSEKQIEWLIHHMGPRTPRVVSSVVNVVAWARCVRIAGIIDPKSMTSLALISRMQPIMFGNQRTYAANTLCTGTDPGVLDHGTKSSVYSAEKAITAGPPRIDMAVHTSVAALGHIQQETPYSLSTKQVKIENVVTDTIIKDEIDLDQLHALLSQVSKYQKTNFPALIIKLMTGVTILVYESGHIIATGSPNPRVLFFTTTFFISNFVIYCLRSEEGRYSLEEALAAVAEGHGQHVLGATRPHMVSDMFASETGEFDVDVRRAMGEVEAVDSDDEAGSMSFSDEDDDFSSDDGEDFLFAAQIASSVKEISERLAETFEGTQEELMDQAKRMARKRLHKSHKKADAKRQKTLKVTRAEKGTDAASLMELTDKYGDHALALMEAISKM